ncbi:MAG: glutamine-hydrolyzing GMP synthase [Candidatus Komeilibacteria bacterium]|nr:glutamine-hydrolyzing GMP synthase [Candidatus Komeilibacteria bacterium]
MLDTFKNATPDALAAVQEEMRVRKTREVFLLFPMGSQFDHLIKQCLEHLGVFCLVADPASVTAHDVTLLEPIGIILSGGPASVYSEPPKFDEKIFDLGIPILGICLGFQMWAQYYGAKVVPAKDSEYGGHAIEIRSPNEGLFAGFGDHSTVWQSHGDHVTNIPNTWLLAMSGKTVAAANYRHLYGVQFHPEVSHTENGLRIFENFCFEICGARDRFPAEDLAMKKIVQLREQIGSKRVLLALSGGSDSSTVAYLLKHALQDKPGQLCGVYIKGIDRPDDERHVIEYFGNQPWIELKIFDATGRFLAALAGHTDMHDKRVAMRSVYKDILENESALFGASFITQGTLYTDISESGLGYASGARKARIKLHHNTGLGLSLEELTPLDDCVKDGGRNIGRAIGVPEELLTRHPFPGPGLAIRIEGEVTAKKLAIAHAIDDIWIQELRTAGLYYSVWQAGAVVTQSVTTCTKGDDAKQGIVVALVAVWSVNGFTAEAAELPWPFLKRVSRRITNEIREVGRAVYNISDKPPATIEWG